MPQPARITCCVCICEYPHFLVPFLLSSISHNVAHPVPPHALTSPHSLRQDHSTTMSGPLPSTLTLLADLPRHDPGAKVRFLGWSVPLPPIISNLTHTRISHL